MRKPQRGDPLKITARIYGDILDTIDYVKALRRSDTASLTRLARDRGLVKIKNESGEYVHRFGILGIDGIISAINPTDDLDAWKSEPVLSGITPASPDHCGRFVVAVEPMEDDAIGWACMSGIVPVQVDFTYDASVYADAKDDDFEKLVASEGGMPVLYKESGTGTKWALVQMGVPYWPVLRGYLDGDLVAGGSATMSVWDGDPLADTGRSVTVYDPGAISSGKKIASGVGLTASFTAGKWYLLTPYACEV
jgi:hypothetical protein